MRARRCSGAFASSSSPDSSPDPVAAAVQTYEDGLAALPTSRMMDLYAQFLREQVICTDMDDGINEFSCLQPSKLQV